MTESPIFIKVLDFLAWLVPQIQKFPREQRLVMAARVHTTAFALHEALVRAAQATTAETTLQQLDEAVTQLTLLRFYLRLCEKLSLIAPKQYEYASQCLMEVGSLLQAWRRKTAATSSKAVPTPASI